MYDLGVCEYCGYKIMDYILWRGISFCNTDCLVEWVENGHKSRPTTGAVAVPVPNDDIVKDIVRANIVASQPRH